MKQGGIRCRLRRRIGGRHTLSVASAVLCCAVLCLCACVPAGVIDHEELLRRNTQHLMSAVSSLPELQVCVCGGGVCVYVWGGRGEGSFCGRV